MGACLPDEAAPRDAGQDRPQDIDASQEDVPQGEDGPFDSPPDEPQVEDSGASDLPSVTPDAVTDAPRDAPRDAGGGDRIIGPPCGTPGQPCCGGNMCAGGGCCVSGRCAASGASCAPLPGVCANGACGGCGGGGL